MTTVWNTFKAEKMWSQALHRQLSLSTGARLLFMCFNSEREYVGEIPSLIHSARSLER